MRKHGVLICTVLLLLIAVIVVAIFQSQNSTNASLSTPDEQKTSLSKTTESTSEKQKSKIEKTTSSTKKTKKSVSKNKSKDSYTVVFKDEEGKIISKQDITKGVSIKEPKAPKKKGYYFYSWSRSVDKVKKDAVITPVYLKDGSVPQLELSRVEAKAGDKNIEVKVNVKNNPGIASLAFDLIYDKKHLKLTGFKYNTEDLNGASTVPFNSDADPACLSMVNGSENITGDFNFATLYFDVLEGAKGGYPIIVTCDDENVYNIDETNVKLEIVNGLINVK